jgi:hypothetical protein
MTTRHWKQKTIRIHMHNHIHGLAFLIWGGQGHHTALAWAKWTNIRMITPNDITPTMCTAEGYPNLTPAAFKKKFVYKKKISQDTKLFNGTFTLLYPAHQGQELGMENVAKAMAANLSEDRSTGEGKEGQGQEQGQGQEGVQEQEQAQATAEQEQEQEQ